MTFTSDEVRAVAASQRAHFHNKTAAMLDAFADRLAHEEQESRIGITGRLARSLFTPTEWALIETKEATARAEGRAEVYAEIAKLDWIDDSDRLYKTCFFWQAKTCFFCQADQPQWLGVQGERAVHEPDCLYLRAQSAVAPPAPDGVD